MFLKSGKINILLYSIILSYCQNIPCSRLLKCFWTSSPTFWKITDAAARFYNRVHATRITDNSPTRISDRYNTASSSDGLYQVSSYGMDYDYYGWCGVDPLQRSTPKKLRTRDFSGLYNPTFHQTAAENLCSDGLTHGDTVLDSRFSVVGETDKIYGKSEASLGHRCDAFCGYFAVDPFGAEHYHC